jgi:hypothetical protein
VVRVWRSYLLGRRLWVWRLQLRSPSPSFRSRRISLGPREALRSTHGYIHGVHYASRSEGGVALGSRAGYFHGGGFRGGNFHETSGFHGSSSAGFHGGGGFGGAGGFRGGGGFGGGGGSLYLSAFECGRTCLPQARLSDIDHRFLREGFDQGLTRLEKLLYFVLVAVSNQDGVSFYFGARLAELLDIRFPHELEAARNELVTRDLIAYESGVGLARLHSSERA